jgi:signal transduction histidine kinase/ActR/RegA family two-component response regulator
MSAPEPARRATALSLRYSLRVRLPLIFSGLIAAIVATCLWVAYREVEATLLRAGGARATAAADQLASLFERSAQQSRDGLRRLAADPDIGRFLREPSDESRAAARARLATLATPGTRRVELWNGAGVRVLEIEGPASGPGPTPALPDTTPPSAAGSGPLRTVQDVTFSDNVAAIAPPPSSPGQPAAAPLGYVLVRGTLAVNPPGALGRLVGTDAVIAFGNTTGGPWTDLSGVVPGPAVDVSRRGTAEYRNVDGSRRLGALTPIRGTPWLVWVEFPQALVVAPAGAFLRRMILVGLVFVALGAVLAGFLSVRITRPLHRLAEAADGIAAGHYAQRVASDRRDEVGRLGAAFDRMADEIASDMEGRTRAAQQLQAQLRRLSLLDQVTRAVSSRQDPQSIFLAALGSLEDNLPVELLCVCLADREHAELTVAAVAPHSRDLASELGLIEGAAIGEEGLSRCLEGHLVHEPDLSESRSPLAAQFARHGLRSLVMAPLLVEHRVFGVLMAGSRTARALSSADCEFLRQLSEHVALAAHQSRLYGELQQAYDEVRRSQQSVMQHERLRVLGQMASGIAHDINNALSPVALYTETLLEEDQSLSPRARAYLEISQRAIEDVAQTIGRLTAFYRDREPELALVPVDLNTLVPQVVDLTRARWHDIPQKRGVVIAMRTDLAPSLPPVMGIESEIREALTNLVFNAVDAMPEGGTLTVRTRVAARATVAPADSPDAGSTHVVHLEIVDTGIGMDEEARRRCWEPFFTTKGERGTGLGLAMVYGVVQRHNAQIEIVSAAGEGTTMRLSFPAVDVGQEESPPAPEVRDRPRPLRMLVVDDDPVLIEALGDSLAGDGHTVVRAPGGQAGIDAFAAAHGSHAPFDVVLTDLGMPLVDGRAVASAVKTLSPTTPVLLLTGWGQRISEHPETLPFVDRVLSKPPKLRELREALTECCRPAAASSAHGAPRTPS